MAAKFKENGDTVGVHLCATVEGEMEKHWKGDRVCPCVGRFFLAWAFIRMMADKTGDDGHSAEDLLAHMLLPQIQGLLVEGKRRAMLAKLKAEVADVELDPEPTPMPKRRCPRCGSAECSGAAGFPICDQGL